MDAWTLRLALKGQLGGADLNINKTFCCCNSEWV